MCAIADREESGERGFERERLVDADLAVTRSETREAIGRDGHDAVGRQRFRQRDVHVRLAVLIRCDRSQPERQHAKVFSQGPGAGIRSSAATVSVAFRREDPARHDALAAVHVEHLERFPHVDGSQDIRRLI